LRHDSPGWTIDSMWVAAGTGPDQRRLHARKDDLSLSASTLRTWLRRSRGSRERGHRRVRALIQRVEAMERMMGDTVRAVEILRRVADEDEHQDGRDASRPCHLRAVE
jgi:hypothetical protein